MNLLTTDEVRNPGYLPGYRTLQSYSMSPYTPQVGALPGGMTPGYGAPMPLGQWTFRFNGFFTASLQGSLNRRRTTTDGQGGPLSTRRLRRWTNTLRSSAPAQCPATGWR